ncbi:uncharacterized protein FA14DRAFT_128414 [Meira miltonrushii]|uniref:DNA polymerase delta subunit 4 n=1 Tax=Meira miltonrushii TaxID=1280837 RepID=A0A316V158_9BASI|nr:uncharacterized protein FA14DRAFT_128414 [Meira miltonrushii]PWN31286.1 hypothetical protein FA14DRAFT_128414 [Meira miltonrushii]
MVTTKARNSGGTSIGRALGKGTKGTTNALQKGKIASIKQEGKSPAVQRSRSVSPTYTKEQLEEAEGRQSLEPNDSRYNALWKETQEKMGMPKHKPIHSDNMNRIQHILRVFDLDPSYGPCLGMTRLERWERAEKLGDEPPSEIREILETKEGILDLKYSVLHDKGV